MLKFINCISVNFQLLAYLLGLITFGLHLSTLARINYNIIKYSLHNLFNYTNKYRALLRNPTDVVSSTIRKLRLC